jgi:hypothetical protein
MHIEGLPTLALYQGWYANQVGDLDGTTELTVVADYLRAI